MNSPIRILYLIGQLGLGGSERQLYLLLKHLDKTRFEPQVVVFNPSPNYTLEQDLRRAGVVVYELPLKYRPAWKRLAWVTRLVCQLQPHILHSWTLHDNAYAALAGLLCRVPVRLGSVRGALVTSGVSGDSLWMRWLVLRGVQGHLVNSPQAVRELSAAGVPAGRIKLLPNCVELDFPQRRSQTPGERRVGMVANLRRVKNYPLFLRGIARLVPEFPFLRGVIAGQPVLPADADVPARIEDEIRRLGLEDHIEQAGFQPDVRALLSGLEIFCLTSDSEGMPNALLEAMAAGLPVIATRVGGIPQVVEHGVTGLLVPPGEVEPLAAALRLLLLDPARARAMGEAGRRRVEREHAPQAILPLLETYYLDLLGRHAAAPAGASRAFMEKHG